MLYFVRHGQSQANLNKTFAGSQVDSPLTEKGREQARETVQSIISSGIKFDKIITSPLSRAYETATLIRENSDNNIDISIDDRLIEIDFGDISGESYTNNDEIDFSIVNNREPAKSIHHRVSSFLDQWNDTDKNILIVSHGFVLKMIYAIQNNINPDDFYDLSDCNNGELICIQK